MLSYHLGFSSRPVLRYNWYNFNTFSRYSSGLFMKSNKGISNDVGSQRINATVYVSRSLTQAVCLGRVTRGAAVNCRASLCGSTVRTSRPFFFYFTIFSASTNRLVSVTCRFNYLQIGGGFCVQRTFRFFLWGLVHFRFIRGLRRHGFKTSAYRISNYFSSKVSSSRSDRLLPFMRESITI